MADPAVAHGVSAAVDRWRSAIESGDGNRLARCYAERHLFNGMRFDRSRLLNRWPSSGSGVTSYAISEQSMSMETVAGDVKVSFSYEMKWYQGCVVATNFLTSGHKVLRFHRVAGDWLIVEETDHGENTVECPSCR